MDIKKPYIFSNNLTMDTTKKNLIETIWTRRAASSCGVCAICSDCGGSSSSWCACARERFFASMSRYSVEELNAMIKK